MERNVEIDKISDGKRYGANDLVKVGCDDKEVQRITSQIF